MHMNPGIHQDGVPEELLREISHYAAIGRCSRQIRYRWAHCITGRHAFL